LTQKSLFNYNNEIDAIVEQDKHNLIYGALRHIVAMLTKRFLNSYVRKTEDEYNVLQHMLLVNKKLYNYDFTDKILRQIYKIN